LQGFFISGYILKFLGLSVFVVAATTNNGTVDKGCKISPANGLARPVADGGLRNPTDGCRLIAAGRAVNGSKAGIRVERSLGTQLQLKQVKSIILKLWRSTWRAHELNR
jgi:hypothetical protein